jgi:hypothetical protein
MEWIRSLLQRLGRPRETPESQATGVTPIAPDILDRNPLSYADPPDPVNYRKVERAIERSWLDRVPVHLRRPDE